MWIFFMKIDEETKRHSSHIVIDVALTITKIIDNIAQDIPNKVQNFQ